MLLCARRLENDCAGAGTMPVGLRQFGGAVLDGKVYLVGGLDNHPENHPTDAIPTVRNFDRKLGKFDGYVAIFWRV